MFEYYRSEILKWSEFIKINKFSKMLNLSSSAVSNFLKYGAHTVSEKNAKDLYDLIKGYLRNFA